MREDPGAVEIRARADGCLVGLRVSAGAARERLVGPHGGRLKIAVREAPERGKANRAVLALLARALGLSPRDLSITAGETSPDKTVLVRGFDAGGLRRLLSHALAEGNDA